MSIPANVRQTIQVFLWSSTVDRGERRLNPARDSFTLPEVPVRDDQTAWVGVIPGRYLLRVTASSRGLSGEENRDIYRRLILDYDRLPQEVEIGDDILELTIPARLMHEINLLSPRAGAAVDLSRDSFRWTEAPGAVRYEVLFNWITIDAQGSTMHTGQQLKSETPHLTPAQFQTAATWFRNNLRNGRTATWSVAAFDTEDRQIGISLEAERPFLIAGEVPVSP